MAIPEMKVYPRSGKKQYIYRMLLLILTLELGIIQYIMILLMILDYLKKIMFYIIIPLIMILLLLASSVLSHVGQSFY